MQLVPVESRALAAVGYEDTSATLDVVFKNGRYYRFFDVPPNVHDELMAAGSRGEYFNAHIRDAYRFERRA